MEICENCGFYELLGCRIVENGHSRVLKTLFEKKSGGKFGRVLKMIAVSLANRLSAQTRKVISAKTTDKKLDELAKAISISGGISAIAVAVSDGGKSGVSKIIGLSAIKN